MSSEERSPQRGHERLCPGCDTWKYLENFKRKTDGKMMQSCAACRRRYMLDKGKYDKAPKLQEAWRKGES